MLYFPDISADASRFSSEIAYVRSLIMQRGAPWFPGRFSDVPANNSKG